MLDFTVAIPTYNSEKRLAEVLKRLTLQLHTASFSWEVIVVDNNSTDGTARVVEAYQRCWPATVPLRYCLEPKQGAAFARQRAVTEAKGTFVGFLDDDNWPTSTWVAAAHAFGVSHPQAGAFGSRIDGAFDVAPPPNFKAIACYLAIIQRGTQPHRYEPHNKVLPPGAALVVRREAWLTAVPSRLVLNNTSKAVGLASEDLEAVLHIQKAGWEVWHNPAMQVYHNIPGWRLERSYLLSLFRCVGLSRHRIRMLRLNAWQRPFAFLMYLVNDVRRLALHWLKYRTVLQHDLVAACETELLIHSVISPFFLWKKQYLERFSRSASLQMLPE
ncbi:glycosyltransferase family 2 protein [Oculatella sp. LEGE 06141]|uniref:hormogonium polysaccharide biosynthesis glycosyltransferase HpsE n=1 Tax=Oculatella sp. LEGE 06141 TaxID=1828648 RepID=UPI00187EDD58|nr:hormogonium polysaccharide biosynthesis glycosyltransferase HpsE [Oculatella sp. LEGE 06141]MBE9182203.1 glycosyltransferase family 2 protein [Oculatella sp. LEGE 06141]